MGSKKLKAVAVRGKGGRPRVANPERLRELAKYARELRVGKAMSFFKLLNVQLPSQNIKQQVCYSCATGCNRVTYEAANGEKGKFFCQAAAFYRAPALKYYKERNEVPFQATRLCNKYGIDTKVVGSIIKWLSKCYSAGILNDEITGIPISKLGSIEFIETLVKKISLRHGFGDVLAQGLYRAANSVGSKAREMITDYADKGGQTTSYGPRLYITTGIFYAVEPRQSIQQLHEVSRPVIKWLSWLKASQEGNYVSDEVVRAIAKRFFGSELAVDFSTYEGKALAARKVQDREYAIDCLILCNKSWPIMDTEQSDDHVGDPTIESSLYSAATGNEVDEEGLYRIGERVLNLQRAILVREGHRGRQEDRLAEFHYTIPAEGDNLNPDCLVPGKDGEPISRKGAVVDREKFEKMQDEYYQLRGWDVSSGLPTRSKLEELHLDDVGRDLEQRGLIA